MAEGTIHPISDRGRRMAEAYRAAVASGGEGRWLAVRLDTGAPVGVSVSRPDVFDTRADAIRHAPEDRHAVVVLNPLPMTPAEATAWLDMHERLWRAGFRFTDPGAQVQPIPALHPMDTAPRPGARPSGLIVPDMIPKQRRRRR